MIQLKLMPGEYHAFFFGIIGPVETQIRMTVDPRLIMRLVEQIRNQEGFWFGQHHSLLETGHELAFMCDTEV